MATNAQHQARYRARQASAGSFRLDTYISANAHAALTTLAQREGASVRAVVETAILNQHKGAAMQSQFRTDDPATDPVSKPRTVKPVSQPATRKESSMTTQQQKPARMTADEAADLEQFKTKLINDHLDAREVQANGGPAGVAHKARINAMLDACNQHRK